MLDIDPKNPDIFYWRGAQRFVRPEFVRFLIDNDLIVYPPEGGLVLGPSHDDKGIQMMRPNGTEFQWIGEMEGLEYMMNIMGTTSHHSHLERINNAHSVNPFLFNEYEPPKNITVLDCRPKTINGVAYTKWIGLTDYSQWIINKESTRQHLSELDQINRETWNGERPFKERIVNSFSRFFALLFGSKSKDIQ